MRMKIITEDRTLRDAVNEFLAFKRAQKLRERTLKDYKKYIDAYSPIAMLNNSARRGKI